MQYVFVYSVHLTSRDKSRDAASYLASKFLTRPDTRDTSLPAFLDWALVTATKGNIWSKLISGIRSMYDWFDNSNWLGNKSLVEWLINMNYLISFDRWGPGTWYHRRIDGSLFCCKTLKKEITIGTSDTKKFIILTYF